MQIRKISITGCELGILLSFALAGCAGQAKPGSIGQMLEVETGGVDERLASRIMAEAPSNSKSRSKVEGEIRKKIWWWLRYDSVRDRERFGRILERGQKYRPLIQQILDQNGLPTELYYLAMIESGYVNHATSQTKAVGIWQFMPPTASRYGLKMQNGIDERRHPITSTYAASQYLKSLHQRFQSWYLAIAAYNAGEGRIERAIREGHSNDFWFLAEGGYLPQETMDYIPKFLAAATIGNHPEQFGFKPFRTNQTWPLVYAVQIRTGMKLSKLAERARVSERELMRLNPGLPSMLANTSVEKVRVWLPKASARFLGSGTSVAKI